MSKNAGEPAFVKNFKRRINKKLEDVVEEANYISKSLLDFTSKLTQKTKCILDDSNSNADVFKDLYDDLENVSEKLFTALNAITELCDEEEEQNNSDSVKKDSSPAEDECSIVNTSDRCSKADPSDDILGESVPSSSEQEDPQTSSSEQEALQTSSGPDPCHEQQYATEQSSSGESSTQLKLDLTPLLGSESKSDQGFTQALELPYNIFDASSAINLNSSHRLPYSVLSDSSYYSASSNLQTCHLQLPGNFQELDTTVPSNKLVEFSSHSSSSSCVSVAVPVHSLHLESNSASKQEYAINDSVIPDPEVNIGIEYTTAVVTNITDPSDFWVQLKIPDESKILYDMYKNAFTSLISSSNSAKVYFLAPSTRSQRYQRAKLTEYNDTSEIVNAKTVEVLFVDFGYIESVQVSELKTLPKNTVSYPVQAIWCKLHGVMPIDDHWSESAVEEFRKICEYSDLQVTVKSKNEEQFSTVIIVTMGTETESVTDVLCLMEFASSVLDSDDRPDCLMNNSALPLLNGFMEESHKQTLHHSSKNMLDHSNARMNFSDISQSSNASLNFGPDHVEQGSHVYLSPVPAKSYVPIEMGPRIQVFHSSSISPASSGFSPNPTTESQGDTNTQPAVKVQKNKIETPFDWTLDIPYNEPKFFTGETSELNYMLVNVCHAISPSHFYVNVVNENVSELDDLREQMTDFYGNKIYKNAEVFKRFQLDANELEPGMFCSCRYFQDNCWYRARVDQVIYSEEPNTANKVRVHYVDYGDSGLCDIQDVYPLTPKFANYSAFAIPCLLAGIVPKISDSEDRDFNQNLISSNGGWSKGAIKRFETLCKQDKCFTAKVMGEKMLGNGRSAYNILLWDNTDGMDYLINDILIDEGYAFVDVSLQHEKLSVKRSESIGCQSLFIIVSQKNSEKIHMPIFDLKKL